MVFQVIWLSRLKNLFSCITLWLRNGVAKNHCRLADNVFVRKLTKKFQYIIILHKTCFQLSIRIRFFSISAGLDVVVRKHVLAQFCPLFFHTTYD